MQRKELVVALQIQKSLQELIEAEEVYKFFGKDGEDYVKDVEEGISGGITNLEEFTRIN